MTTGREPFQLVGVTHLLRPWGEPVAGLDAMLERVGAAPDEVLFAHSVCRLLRDATLQGQVMDDLSHWIATALQDPETAERLWLAVGTAFPRATAVREAMLEVLGSVPARRRGAREAPPGAEFTFLSAVPVHYRSGEPFDDPRAAVAALLEREPAIWFHHLHEEPWDSEGSSTLLEWLRLRGESALAERLAACTEWGLGVELARTRFRKRWRLSQASRRVVSADGPPEQRRRDAARGAAAMLVRRLTHEEDTP